MPTERRSFWTSTQGLAALGLIGAATYFLLTEHRQHLFAALPYLILLACPLMHLFMHHGHDGHDHHEGSSSEAYRRGFEDGRRQHPPSTTDDEQGH